MIHNMLVNSWLLALLFLFPLYFLFYNGWYIREMKMLLTLFASFCGLLRPQRRARGFNIQSLGESFSTLTADIISGLGTPIL